MTMPTTSLDGAPLRRGEAEVEPGVRLRYVEAGSGPLVVLLHGFPDSSYGWRRQIPALAAAGFRVVAPDQRGYGLSDKPAGARAYGIRRLADDVAALVAALGESRAHVVGHDWGAGVAWAFAMRHPERLARLAVLNGPHPERMLKGLANPVQLAGSWYMFFFQLPALPERRLARDDYAILARAMQGEPRPGLVTDADLAVYREGWSRPGALTSMVHWYRAMFLPSARGPMRPIEAPALVLWGDADPHLGASLARPRADLVPNARVVMIHGASHWVQIDAAERVNAELVAHLRG
jgi:pimeloyl-ACP methyl ester carboxylesterase